MSLDHFDLVPWQGGLKLFEFRDTARTFRKVPNRNKTNSSLKPNKCHSKYVCFGSQMTHEEREICLKICLFGFPEMLVIRSATTAAHEVVSSSTLIGPFEFEHTRKFNGCSHSRSDLNGPVRVEDETTFEQLLSRA